MSATTVSLSNPTIWLSTLVGISVCVSRARLFRARTGRDAWRMPLWGWALVGFFLGLVAAVLALIATRRSAMAAAQAKAGGFGAGGFGAGRVEAGRVEAGRVEAGRVEAGRVEATSVTVWPPTVNGSVGPTSAGWYPLHGDPHEQMYFDGTRWTTRIRWDGVAWIDAGRPPEAPEPAPQKVDPPPPSSAFARFFMK